MLDMMRRALVLLLTLPMLAMRLLVALVDFVFGIAEEAEDNADRLVNRIGRGRDAS